MATRRTLWRLPLLGLLLALPVAAQSPLTLGTGVSVLETTPIHAILADPDAYVGKTVRIEGGVLDVCPMKGCWVEVAGEEGSLKVKVDDGVIVFPADAKGKVLTAQGTVEAVEMTRDAYVAWLTHLAEEKGETLDATASVIGTGPFRTIRLRGTGAELE